MAMPEKYSAIEERLDEPLDCLIRRQRVQGLSWRLIAMDVTKRTGIDVAGETIRVWHQGITPVSAGPSRQSAA